MRTTIVAATCAVLGVALAALPGVSWAQSATQGSMEKSGVKGSPNANGYGKSDESTTKAPANDETPSASNLKGPPNANGYGKQ